MQVCSVSNVISVFESSTLLLIVTFDKQSISENIRSLHISRIFKMQFAKNISNRKFIITRIMFTKVVIFRIWYYDFNHLIFDILVVKDYFIRLNNMSEYFVRYLLFWKITLTFYSKNRSFKSVKKRKSWIITLILTIKTRLCVNVMHLLKNYLYF